MDPETIERMQQRQAQVYFFVLWNYYYNIQQQAEEERRISILDQVLEPAAKDRIGRLSSVKKEKTRQIEDSIIQAALGGQLKAKVGILI